MARLTRAYQNGDVDGLVALLTEDVLMTMPPIPLEYLGRELVARFLRAAIFLPGIALRPVPARANGQPALVMYQPDPRTGIARASGVLVFTLTGSHVSAITRFDDTVLPRFGSPRPCWASCGLDLGANREHRQHCCTWPPTARPRWPAPWPEVPARQAIELSVLSSAFRRLVPSG